MTTNTVWTIGIISGLMLLAVCIGWYQKVRHYQKAKCEIFKYVKSYKIRCAGANRFVVTVSDLQDAFREYDTITIEKVHEELIQHNLISRDPMDQEWCVR